MFDLFFTGKCQRLSDFPVAGRCRMQSFVGFKGYQFPAHNVFAFEIRATFRIECCIRRGFVIIKLIRWLKPQERERDKGAPRQEGKALKQDTVTKKVCETNLASCRYHFILWFLFVMQLFYTFTGVAVVRASTTAILIYWFAMWMCGNFGA